MPFVHEHALLSTTLGGWLLSIMGIVAIARAVVVVVGLITMTRVTKTIHPITIHEYCRD